MTKKEKIEFTARELFLKHGFKKVTIDEVCRKAHVSRKTYYSFYENKLALVAFIIQQISDETYVLYKSVLEGPGSFAEKLERSLELKYKFNKTITMEFVADFFDPSAADILELWKELMGKSIAMQTEFFKEGQRTGEMNPDLDLNFVFSYFQKVSEIMQSPGMMDLFSTPEEMVRQVTQLLVYGIMPANTTSTSINK